MLQSHPKSVNYHLNKPCNMDCMFCFAPFNAIPMSSLYSGALPEEEAVEIVRETAKLMGKGGKINFVGGEPLLVSFLPTLINLAASLELVTSIVTNASLLTNEFLDKVQGSLHWVGMSIDSANPKTQEKHGRAIQGHALRPEYYIGRAAEVRTRGIRLKINVVVTALNVREDLSDFLLSLGPERVKLFQVLPVEGENAVTVESLLISKESFEDFVGRHKFLEANGIKVVGEDNDAMTGSYAMINPLGQFFDNEGGFYSLSESIVEVGAVNAFRQISFSELKQRNRDGIYDWSPTVPKTFPV